MSGALAAAYPWIKALHVVAVIAWMAGLLYLPRLYVYHSGLAAGSEQATLFATMERRLLRGIMLPALVMTYGFGILLAGTPGVVDWRQGWIWAKLAAVAVLTLFHMMLARWRRELAAGQSPHSARFFRIVNEIPTLAMIAIVVFVIVKPF